MPLTDPERIARDAARPRIVALWQALQPLRNILSFMQSGAHPDDETSAMMAALGFRDGFSLSYACANRGEGGQNNIGTERTENLGVLRTAEMERASDVLNMRLYWLSERGDDPIFDFGLSKSGEETLAKWGKDRTLARMVDILRTERPDLLCTTFLDVPGQHGHHRAMTQTALDAFEAAADPAYGGSVLPVWNVSRLFLPAWSGAGGAYDDEVPPPAATTHVSGQGFDPVTGWDWARIGQQSRAFHLTQGMGQWIPPDHVQPDWPLHCALSRSSDRSLCDGLPLQFHDSGFDGALDAQLDETVDAFPDFDAVRKAAAAAVTTLRALREAATPATLSQHGHRLDRAEIQLAVVIRLAAGAQAEAHTDSDWLHPGGTTRLHVSGATRAGDMKLDVALPDHWIQQGDDIQLAGAAAVSDPYPASYDPLAPPKPHLRVTLHTDGTTTWSILPLVTTPQVLPSNTVALAPAEAVVNRAAGQSSLEVAVQGGRADVRLDLPDAWQSNMSDTQFTVSLPADVSPGLYSLPAHVGAEPAHLAQTITHAHVDHRAWVAPAVARVRVLDAALPENTNVAYIGAGQDTVSHWLRSIGVGCQDIDAAQLRTTGWMDDFDTIILGIFALRFVDGLTDLMPSLRNWVSAGGNLVTLYHRPWDNWDKDISPRPLEIGQPSLRWRVTDEHALVTHLAPEHAILTTPNRIGPEDWSGWHKERGLYFARSWDPAYTPLLSMADPGETPHHGSLLSADIDEGRHTHCALILHHQMEKLVPGAFRLMANIITPR